MATLALLDNQHCSFTIEADDSVGNPTSLPAGAVTWTSSNSSIVAVAPSPDGMSCDVAAVGPLGTAQVAVSVVVDASTTLTGTIDVTVSAGAAATLKLVPGTPVSK